MTLPAPTSEAGAREILASHPLVPRKRWVPLEQALGFVLARPVRADRDLPPFDRSAVDGYALRLAEPWNESGSRFLVRGVIAAGQRWTRALRPGEAVQIMTGAPVPRGADGVVISFNGRRHDLPFLQLRRRHCGMFARSPLDRYVGKGAGAHIDMMELLGADGLRWPSLDEACTALGIPHRPHGEAVSTVPAPIRKCETDVLATFLLYLVDQAAARGSARCLLEGWTALAAWCLADPGAAHRAQFATTATARAAMRAARAP